MKINIEHIEERMFDYYEGNLSEQERNDLLNLIHQHPEYEVEFTRWAQSYAHVDHAEPDYGLTKQLLKKPSVYAYINRYTVITSVLLILSGILTYSYMYETEVLQEQSVQTIQAPKISVEKAYTPVSISKVKSKIADTAKEKDIESVVTTSNVSVNENMQLSGSVSDSTSTQAAVMPSEVIVTADEKQKIDTAAAAAGADKTNTVTQEKKKVKYKTKVTLKPSPDIIPTNPNF